jgi:TetR/AcrR family transcriptional regulator, transcriptional repressor for nem operon
MKKSKAETALTRRRIVETAATLFRRNGIHETGIAEVMAAAGLTQGGFYRHFDSKNQLVAEACSVGTHTTLTADIDAAACPSDGRGVLQEVIGRYLSTEHRDNPSDGCMLTCLGSELARADEDVRAGAAVGFKKMVDTIAEQFRDIEPESAKARAVFVVVAMIGAVTMSRTVPDAELSELILQQTREHLADL